MSINDSSENENIEIADLCFEDTTEPIIWTCKFCQKQKKCARKQARPANLVYHIKSQHPDDFVNFIEEAKKGVKHTALVQSKISTGVDLKSLNVYNWINLMTKLDVPFSWAENELFLKYSVLKKL